MPRMISKLLDILLPRRCVACDGVLNADEPCICPACQSSIPYYPFSSFTDNDVLRLVWGEHGVEKAAVLMRYTHEAKQQAVIDAMKYGGRPDVCQTMGIMLADTIASDGFFADIDGIIPIPLSRRRYKKRGYNQAQHLANGMAKVSGLPVLSDVLIREVDNVSQTHLSEMHRLANASGIFQLRNPHVLNGKHILLVDDIVTTGATLRSAVGVLCENVPGIKISIACLAMTSHRTG